MDHEHLKSDPVYLPQCPSLLLLVWLLKTRFYLYVFLAEIAFHSDGKDSLVSRVDRHRKICYNCVK